MAGWPARIGTPQESAKKAEDEGDKGEVQVVFRGLAKTLKRCFPSGIEECSHREPRWARGAGTRS